MSILAIILGIIGGAIGMFFFDPNTGNRRRALVCDQVLRFRHRTPDALDALSKQARNEAQGVMAETKARFRREPVSDETLVERVRAAMGRYVSHPGAVHVSASGGDVTLSGAILMNEAEPFLKAVKHLPGVQQIYDYLQRYESGENIPDLQGGQTRTELR